MFNLIGGAGAGKTTLLEASAARLRQLGHEALVLEAELATDASSRRKRAEHYQAIQIDPGRGCHVDAGMVATGLRRLGPPDGSVVFVENVGNLVCPARFDLGECARIAIMPVTAGEAQPIKYPGTFRSAALLLVTKLDLVRYLNFNLRRCLAYAYSVNPNLETVCVAAPFGAGIEAWCNWVDAQVERHRVNPT